MTAKQRISRRDLLKKPDEFIVFTQRVVNFFQEKPKIVFGVIGALSVAAVLFGFFHLQRTSDNELASRLEQEGTSLFSARQTAGVYGMEQIRPDSDIKKAMDKYKEIIQNYPDTQHAQRALVYIGDCYFRLRDFDNAEKNYLQYLEEYPEEGFFTMAVKESLGYVYETKKDYNKAISYFSNVSNNLPEKEQLRSYINVGRCYEEMGKFDLAMDKYQKVIDNIEGDSQNPQVQTSSYNIDRIKAKIAQLKSR